MKNPPATTDVEPGKTPRQTTRCLPGPRLSMRSSSFEVLNARRQCFPLKQKTSANNVRAGYAGWIRWPHLLKMARIARVAGLCRVHKLQPDRCVLVGSGVGPAYELRDVDRSQIVPKSLLGSANADSTEQILIVPE